MTGRDGPSIAAAPARPAQPALPPGPHARRRGKRSAGLALQQGAAAGGLAVGFENPARNQPERIVPFQANPTLRLAGLNAWSVWQQITAGEAADYVLAGMQVNYLVLDAGNINYQLGIGPAGAEVPIFEWGTAHNIGGAVGTQPLVGAYVRTPFIKIPAATRIAVRTYWATAGVTQPRCGVYLALLPLAGLTWSAWSDAYPQGTRATSQSRTPAVPNFINVAAAGYTQILAAAPSDLLLYAVTGDKAGIIHGQLAVATGAAGAEVDHAILPMGGCLLNFFWYGYTMPCRPVLIHAGERVAARYDYNSGGLAQNLAFYFTAI